ncbi:helix-turn-helix domain-containing protein [Staphylococcus simiae]|uniref:helix-turn-helix domain-containing protein n=1 Tax=Staphylococcus simiae TaxID=308354 RepID=UPI001A95AB16|nr:XRE family transcriptional regulator [Staphylococcus simiae]MBO1198899.1 helix-turn-helix domain-containing protein [Staphylococcus simiae]MBO1201075.1 helix-turn-helix domain-containing protein [Staphylococcus simiae]MBO1203299.1 helix-turn-helix domain-containing protein [Staphylococcus simiae]MBO1210752.1 helix-turn-helix domain-containing protein [Staphylococcus simiae]MBO1229413.1 helix-turn-helix domain-containing protein [Staphylococcus simiae]
MANVNEIIGYNLYRYRQDFNLSLDKMADITGVSKNMLNQIEKGQANPSIMTLSKIANGLRLSLSELITQISSEVNPVAYEDLIPIYNEDHSVTIFPYFPYSPEKDFEMFKMEIEAFGAMTSEGHHQGSDEYIIVTDGTLTLEIEDNQYIVTKEQAIHFKSDVAHQYINQTNNKLSLIATIQYHS